MSGGENDKFEEEKFMKILVNLKDTQESIQGFSGWCIKNRKAAYKMARCWIKVIKKVRIEQKLVLFYLVNDIVQHSAKRNYGELLDKFRSGIKEAMPHLKEEKIGPKVQRCLDIWEEREVFDADFIQELTGLIDLTPVKEDEEIVENFQPTQLCTQIKIMKALEDDADYKLKTLKENDLDNKDIEEIKLRLKDKHCGDEFVHEFEDGTKRMEQYIKAMEREITKRRQVIELLGQGKKYYDSLYGEAEIVATAYSNFGQRVKKVAVKLKERSAELSSSCSPVPSPDYDAPSPAGSGDEMEIRLPDEQAAGEAASGRHPAPPDLTSRLNSLTGGSTDISSRLLASEEDGDSMFGDQFKMMGVETPVKQEIGIRVEGGQQLTTGDPADVKEEEGSLVPRKEMLLMLASTIGEDSGAGLLSEQEPHRQAAYDAYSEQDVQVLCRAAPRNLSFTAGPSLLLKEDLLEYSRPERDDLGFYTEHPENQLTNRSLEARMSERKDAYGERKEQLYGGGGPKEAYGGSGQKEQYSISEFLTKMAQGEQVDVGSFTRGALQEGDTVKRRRLSGGRREYEEPVPDWLTRNDGEEVENLALSRLRQAAKKNPPEAEKGNNGVGSNLIPLIGSPGARARVVSGGNRRSCDMDLSEGEEGEVWEDGELRPGWPEKWGDRAGRKGSPSPPPDNGHITPRAPPPPSFSAAPFTSRQFSGPPPPTDHFAGPPPGGATARRHLEGPPPPPPFQSAETSPPFQAGNGPSPSSFHTSPPDPPPPFLSPPGFPPSGAQPPHHFDSPRGGMRGGFENRGHRSGSDPSPRFARPPLEGNPGSRFPGPPPSFSRGGGRGAFPGNGGNEPDRFDADGGGFEGHNPGKGIEGSPGGGFRGRGGFRGGFSDVGRGGFSEGNRGGYSNDNGGHFDGARGRGSPRGPMGPRRPWGGPRGRGRGAW